MLKTNIVESHIFCLQKWHIDKDMKIYIGKSRFMCYTLQSKY